MIHGLRYYARLEDVTKGKTPKYAVAVSVGYYPPMKELQGTDGKISLYLLASRDSGCKDNAPAMKLQAKNSFNFTGLKEFYQNGQPSKYAYGYPSDKRTYSKAGKANPFFAYKNDLFLFVIHYDERSPMGGKPLRPFYIELIVIAGAKVIGASFLKQLSAGGLDEELRQLRELAQRTADV